MSKKQAKQAQSVPTYYEGLTIRPDYRTICVMEDLNGIHSLHNNKQALERLTSFSALIADTISKCWEGFDAFDKENEQTKLTYHANLFGSEPPKDQALITTSLHVWHKLIQCAKTDMTTQVPVSASGRKSTLLTSEYRIGDVTEGTGDLKTPQALACLRLFRACIGTDPMVTEATLKKYIEDHASELHTRQDPWRIFQYYRPNLIANKLIKRS